MDVTIALAGNPNCGKTTLFNALTGSNQFVGNWPGVTVEKKEGKLKDRSDITLTDLPGIYSLSPYTLEEVVARKYLIDEHPDAILNIVDGTNLERNLYLTTQLVELGIPVVIAINMMDVVKKSGDDIDTEKLSRRLGCRVVEISALKSTGIKEAAEAAAEAAQSGITTVPRHNFSGAVEHAIAHIEEACVHDMPEEQQRWYAIKIFERDEKVLEKMNIPKDVLEHIEGDIRTAEKEMDDDSDAIIINERYNYIAAVVDECCKRKNHGGLSSSDKIDSVVTSRWLGLPIFVLIMFLVYYISIVSVGKAASDWANNGLFGAGFHLVGVGDSEYDEHAAALETILGAAEVAQRSDVLQALDFASMDYDPQAAQVAVKSFAAGLNVADVFTYEIENEETLAVETKAISGEEVKRAAEVFVKNKGKSDDPSQFGIWVPGIPVLIGNALEALDTPAWLTSLILDGIVAGVGSVLGFLPQMMVLFFMLSFLEACGYMSRIAFVLDRIFHHFGLSGKSFIPILIGTGCGIPGIMASRTIENECDRRMTVITTTFIPCGAKIPVISMIAGAIFGGSAWVATSAYFIGMAAIIGSGIMLKKTPLFAGKPTPFVMELPAYHLPTFGNVMRAMWDRSWSFVKKAGTVILISTVILWFMSHFGFVGGELRLLASEEIGSSLLAAIGGAISWIFAPLGWGTWQSAVATITGLIAKENIVGTMGVLYGSGGASAYSVLATVFTGASAFSFLIFNLLCAPCFGAIGAIRKEMNSLRWTLFAVGYQCCFAYAVSLMIFQFCSAASGSMNIFGLAVALVVMATMIFMLVKPDKNLKKYK